MDWITLTRQEVNDDALPDVCVHCGRSAGHRRNETFTWVPVWVNWLYWLGLFPGAIAASYFSVEMRVSLPVCADHFQLKRGRFWWLVCGWVVLPGLVAGAGFLGVFAMQELWSLWNDRAVALIVGPSIGAGAGLLIWLLSLPFVLGGTRSIEVKEITDEGIDLVGLDDAFVKAVREARRANDKPRLAGPTGEVPLPPLESFDKS